MAAATRRALALVLVCLATTASAQPHDVLVLEAGAAARPFTAEFTQALAQAFDRQGGDRPGLYFEWLDRDRFPGPQHPEAMRAYLAAKYAGRPPDVVVALGGPAAEFMLEARDTLWPEAGLVVAATSDATAVRVRSARRAVALTTNIDLRGTIAAALAVLPDTEAVALVTAGDSYLPQIDGELADGYPRLRVIRLVDLPLADIQQRIATLPPHTVVLYSQFTLDPAGRAYAARQVLTELARLSNRPIVGYAPSYLGFGILAGSYRDIADTSADVARVVMRMLDGEPADRIDARTVPPRPHFDARELARWGIDEARLPAGSLVAFRPPTLWSQYRTAVIVGLGVITLQAMLIAALAYAVRQRRAAEMQARLLSRRVLTAQEDERRRIARELHDGANQEIALFAMQLDRSGQATLADRARGLSTDLHRLSHELHPAILDQLGLVQALQQFGEQLEQGHGLRVDVRASHWPASVPPAIAITLYRVAQEALQNVSRHSGAAAASVDLQATPEGLSMTVADSGAGFDPARQPGAGLGLAGMQERLRGVGGELSVDTSRRAGTRIVATIPQPAVVALEDDPAPGLPAMARQS